MVILKNQQNLLDKYIVQQKKTFKSQHGELVQEFIKAVDLHIENLNKDIHQQKIIINFYKEKIDILDSLPLEADVVNDAQQESELPEAPPQGTEMLDENLIVGDTQEVAIPNVRNSTACLI